MTIDKSALRAAAEAALDATEEPIRYGAMCKLFSLAHPAIILELLTELDRARAARALASQMSNVLWNLARGADFTQRERDICRDLARQWDERARKAGT